MKESIKISIIVNLIKNMCLINFKIKTTFHNTNNIMQVQFITIMKFIYQTILEKNLTLERLKNELQEMKHIEIKLKWNLVKKKMFKLILIYYHLKL
jgi:hypothetical protein